MRIASWNVRGFSNHHTQIEVANLIKRQQLDVLGILETKLEELEDLHNIMEHQFAGWYGAHNFDHTPGGRIALLWNPRTVALQVLSIADQFIHYSIQCRTTQTLVQVSFVYGFYSVVARRSIWDGINSLGNSMEDRWICVCDYNAYLNTIHNYLAPELLVDHLMTPFFSYGPCLGDEERARLESDVSEAEIRAALFDIHDYKALGPDGYFAHFFKKAWSMVGPLLIEAVTEFFSARQLSK